MDLTVGAEVSAVVRQAAPGLVVGSLDVESLHVDVVWRVQPNTMVLVELVAWARCEP